MRIGDQKQSAIAGLASDLKSGEERVRIDAVLALQEIDAPESCDLLTSALRSDTSVAVKLGSALALLRKEDGKSERALLEVLTDNGSIKPLIDILTGTRDGLNVLMGTMNLGDPALRRLELLVDNPSLLEARLAALETGTAGRELAARFERLREPMFRGIFAAIAGDRELLAEYRSSLANRSDFVLDPRGRAKSAEPSWLKSRTLTGMLVSFFKSARLRALWNSAIDRYSSSSSSKVWEQCKNPDTIPYFRCAIVGAGVSAANLSATLTTLDPDNLTLVIDSRKRIGGTFALSLAPFWKLNSRSRKPTDQRQLSIGGESELNSCGPYSLVSESDLSDQAYASQDVIGYVIRSNLALSSVPLTEARVVRYIENDPVLLKSLGLKKLASKAFGYYLVEIERDGETGYVSTDIIPEAIGPGKFKVGLDLKDEETRRIIEKEFEDFRKKGFSRVVTFDQYAELIDNPNAETFLASVAEVLVAGDGDGGAVVCESLTGYGPEGVGPEISRKSLRNITWVGQESPNKEAFLKCNRARYIELGNELPRIEVKDYKATIIPQSGKALRLKEGLAGGLVVECVSNDNKSFSVTADFVVLSPGLETEGTKIPLIEKERKDLVVTSDIEIRFSENEFYRYYNNAPKPLPAFLGSFAAICAGSKITIQVNPNNRSGRKYDFNIEKVVEDKGNFRVIVQSKEISNLPYVVMCKPFDTSNKIIEDCLRRVAKDMVGDSGNGSFAANSAYSVIVSQSYEKPASEPEQEEEGLKIDRELVGIIDGARDSLSKVRGQAKSENPYVGGVFSIGPNARLPIASSVASLAKQIDIPENTASIWVSSGRITTFGENIIVARNGISSNRKALLTTKEESSDDRPPSVLSNSWEYEVALPFSRVLRKEANREDYIRYAVAASLSDRSVLTEDDNDTYGIVLSFLKSDQDNTLLFRADLPQGQATEVGVDLRLLVRDPQLMEACANLLGLDLTSDSIPGARRLGARKIEVVVPVSRREGEKPILLINEMKIQYVNAIQ